MKTSMTPAELWATLDTSKHADQCVDPAIRCAEEFNLEGLAFILAAATGQTLTLAQLDDFAAYVRNPANFAA
jgi:hypothetical protein